jgi:hypothetical protein
MNKTFIIPYSISELAGCKYMKITMEINSSNKLSFIQSNNDYETDIVQEYLGNRFILEKSTSSSISESRSNTESLKLGQTTEVMIDEIINWKHVAGIQIDDSCHHFVVNNIFLFLIHSSSKMYHEIPTVIYSDELTPHIKDPSSSFGPYFYFTAFSETHKHRVLLVCGNTLVVHLPSQIQRKTLFKQGYDTIYVGKIQLSENVVNEEPCWVVFSKRFFTSL